MNINKIRPSLMVLLIALIFPPLSFAVEIKGKVVEVEGSRAKIAYKSDFMPVQGDKIQIGDEISGIFVPVDGDWRIVKVTRDFAWAESKDADTGTPDPGYLAIIQSENPQKRSDLTAETEKPVTEQSGGGSLGVMIGPLTPDLKKKLNIFSGAHVLDVQRDSAAEKAGIKKGDAITEFNGRQISRVSDLPRMVSALSPGTRVKIKIIREGRIKIMNTILGKLPEAAQYFQKGAIYLKKKDYAEAARWFRKAAEQGNRRGYLELGHLYENGWGVPKDEGKAEEYYRQFGDYVKEYQRGARGGNKEAQKWLKKRGLKW